MDKPFSVLHEEFKTELANLINKSTLPPSVIESVLQNYLYEVNTFAKNRFQIEKIQYEKFLLENKEKNKTNKDINDNKK